MLSFFEVFHLLETGWRDKFTRTPSSVAPVPNDPNANVGQQVGQTGNKAIRHRLNPHGPVAKVGRDVHGSVTWPQNQKDAEASRVERDIRKQELGDDVPINRTLKNLQKQDKFMAANLLKQMLGNPTLIQNQKYGFTVKDLLTALNIPADQAMLVKQALKDIMSEPQSGLTVKDRPGFSGNREHVYFISQGTISDPDEDQRVLGPRQTNPALRGGRGTVGTPQATPASPKGPVDKTPPSLQMLLKLHNQLDDLTKTGGGNVTQARGIYTQMKELLGAASKEVTIAAERNPQDASEWQSLLGELEKYVQSIPVNFGSVPGEPPRATPVRRRILPYHQAAPPSSQNLFTGQEEWRYY